MQDHTEMMSMAIVNGNKAYEKYNHLYEITDYLSIILYELLIRKRVTQHELVKMSDLPKQSINKGIHLLEHQGYLKLKIDQHDKRQKVCELTEAGEKYAKEKIDPLIELEQKVAQKMGAEKMEQLAHLSKEWSDTFWQLLLEKEKR